MHLVFLHWQPCAIVDVLSVFGWPVHFAFCIQLERNNLQNDSDTLRSGLGTALPYRQTSEIQLAHGRHTMSASVVLAVTIWLYRMCGNADLH